MTTFSADDRDGQDLDAAREEIRHLQRALATRPVIDQAKGMLMARHGCSAEEAFGMLAAASQRDNRPVSELARRIVEHAGPEPCPPVVGASGRSGPAAKPVGDPVSGASVDIDSVLLRALERDLRAERRDRDAEARDVAAERRCPAEPDASRSAAADREQAAIDRVHAGADRDAGAADRAELLWWRNRPSSDPA